MASNPFSVLERGPNGGEPPALPGPSRAKTAPINSNGTPTSTPRKKKNRSSKKRRQRRKSFAAPSEDMPSQSGGDLGEGFYRQGRNISNDSLDSEALLDHREHQYPRIRRTSVYNPTLQLPPPATSRLRSVFPPGQSGDEDDLGIHGEGAPLLSSSHRPDGDSGRPNYGSQDSRPRLERLFQRRDSSRSSSRKLGMTPLTPGGDKYNNVNFPPSVPGSPNLGPMDPMDLRFEDAMMRDERPPMSRAETGERPDDLVGPPAFERRNTISLQAQEDVCFPQEGMSEMADDELHQVRDAQGYRSSRRRRRGKWPDLSILEDWSRFEKEGRSEERRMKKITEPQLINGRLRPVHKGWYKIEEDAPYRFTYFNEEFQSTIHSQTISELVQEGTSFRELFIPDPPLLSDSSDDEPDEPLIQTTDSPRMDSIPKGTMRQSSLATTIGVSDKLQEAPTITRRPNGSSGSVSRDQSGEATPSYFKSPLLDVKSPQQSILPVKAPRYGDRPVWWLDILSPTEAEMKVISKTFGIHPLTAEDIMLQEEREKVELFRHYYFVSYRTFDQDISSDMHLEPINMYVVVFREGVLTFHFSQTPHPANVRRRIRQLKDYMVLSSDWISYAIIDDITDVYVPHIQSIEEEVDDIDDSILQLHSHDLDPDAQGHKSGDKDSIDEGDMLRRVGDCRKKVMRLYRLLGNKADVIKGFAKRCNEHWDVAPRSEIGLYLGDIQDHIVTMTSNLSHYELILSRSHANYLAQINIRMNERQEQTADVLGKLTVLGTIVLPMNIITGLWGMNVWVPGQEYEGDLKWFVVITIGLLMFGICCYWIAKRVYKIV